MSNNNISCSISYSNVFIEGVPGFSFIIVKKDDLYDPKIKTKTLSLDPIRQWNGFENYGEFRSTPHTYSIFALHQALKELNDENEINKKSGEIIFQSKKLVEGIK